MHRSSSGWKYHTKITLVIIAGIIALAQVMPAAGAGQEGNGKMLLKGIQPRHCTLGGLNSY
ncbi:MAG TPA: hypothetical protein VN372_11635 [Methanospirillum sp.]|nr:hypothetical protein [Methanospirillum sp.]